MLPVRAGYRMCVYSLHMTTTEPSPSFAVLILFYERAQQTIQCIESFLPAGVPIHVLDNGSSAEAREVLNRRFADVSSVHVTRAEENLGVAAGRNRQIAETGEDWLFFVDNDIRVQTRRWPKRLRAHIAAEPGIEAWIPRQRQLPEGGFVRYKPFVIEGDRVHREKKLVNGYTNAFPGGASIVSRRLFDRLGSYDDALFVGHEDYELCLRGLTQGRPVRARHIRNVRLIHEHRMAVVEGDREAARTRYAQENIARSAEHVRAKHGVVIAVGDDDAWSRTQREIFLDGRIPRKWRSPIRRLRKRVRALFRKY